MKTLRVFVLLTVLGALILTACGTKEVEVTRVVTEKEFRDAAAKVASEDLTINKSVDALGITVQEFKVREYEYASKVTACASEYLKTVAKEAAK